MQVNITKRIDTPEGKRYCPVVIGPNGRIKPDWVMMNDRQEKHPEGAYYLDWNEDGKRRRMSVGNDAAAAYNSRVRKQRELDATAAGLVVSNPIEDNSRLRIRSAVDDFLEEILLTRQRKTWRGYADDLFNIFYRMEPHAMVREGFAYGGQGRRDFQEQYGVLETIEKVEEADNACSRATKKTVRVLRKPGASPMLFGKFLMTTTAFLSLEDISDNLPRYDESVISVDMDDALQQAYEQLEEDIRSAMKAHRGNKSLMSILLNTLLLYPDHPYDFDQIWARAFDPQTKEYVKFLVTEPENLTREALYAKERALIADVKEELRQGRRCQVYATYTGEKDVTLRLEAVLRQEGIRVAVLRSSVATDKREDWYDRQLKAGVEVVICHPKLVETGLDLLAFPTLYFYETGYSLHTLRQASRRSWRIGQRFPVRVKFVTYSGTMQETCLRLMGKKMLVALMMEGKFSGEGLQALDTDEDLMSAMARELVEKAGVGESADAVWRDLGHEREKVQPRPAAVEPGLEEEPDPVLDLSIGDLPVVAAAEPAPTPFGIHLIEPNQPSKRRKKTAIWPTATDTNVQLSLFD